MKDSAYMLFYNAPRPSVGHRNKYNMEVNMIKKDMTTEISKHDRKALAVVKKNRNDSKGGQTKQHQHQASNKNIRFKSLISSFRTVL